MRQSSQIRYVTFIWWYSMSSKFTIQIRKWGNGVKFCARFDAGQGRFHYAVMLITSKDDWLFYKQFVKGSQVGCAEIVVVLQRVGQRFTMAGMMTSCFTMALVPLLWECILVPAKAHEPYVCIVDYIYLNYCHLNYCFMNYCIVDNCNLNFNSSWTIVI